VEYPSGDHGADESYPQLGRTIRSTYPRGQGAPVIFTETSLSGAFVLDIERRIDERGFFTRTYCQREFESHGLLPTAAQCNLAFNARAGTLRGMHWRAQPLSEAKLVRVVRGAILDVIIDLRPNSSTYLRHEAVELNAENHRALYVPPMFAHGFQTLTDHTEVFYHMSELYDPEFDRAARWNDPAFGIRWPLPNPILNERDRSYPDFKP
jgi:dTDP-4-dehydrorhamnose 3,5-epimerase